MPLHAAFTYAEHAQARIEDRAIYKKQVRRTVRRPDRHYLQGPNSVAEYDTKTGIVIRVVYRLADPGSVQIVTAVRLGKHEGAWQRELIKTFYDRAHDVAYISLLHGEIAETLEVASGIYHDVDSFGEVLGVEVFDYSRYKEGISLSIFERRLIASP